MTQNQCVVCGRPTPDGYACTTETERARQQLLGDDRDPDRPGIVELVEPARAVAYRQISGESIASSAPGPRDLLDYGAGQRLMNVQIALTGWARAVAEECGRPNWDGTESPDLIIRAADYLVVHLEWCRHKPWVDEMLREIGDCAAAMRGIVATPAGRVHLGKCGAKPRMPEPWETGTFTSLPCDGDVYGKPGKAAAYCNECGAAYDQAERRVQVAKLVQGGNYRASQLEHAYGLSAATVRKWAERDLIVARERDGQGRPLYRLDEVLAVAASEQQRRDAARQKREQRRGEVAAVTPG